MAKRHGVTVIPITIGFRDERLHVDARKTVGFRAVCSCGYSSRGVRSVAEARQVGAVHVAEHQPVT